MILKVHLGGGKTMMFRWCKPLYNRQTSDLRVLFTSRLRLVYDNYEFSNLKERNKEEAYQVKMTYFSFSSSLCSDSTLSAVLLNNSCL